MPFYAMHAIVTIVPGGTSSPEHSHQRLDVEWPTPIEYASDIKEVQLSAAAQCLSAWRGNDVYKITNPNAYAVVQVLSWQPLKGGDRPEGEVLA